MFVANFDFAGEKGNLAQFGQLIEDIQTKLGLEEVVEVKLIPCGPGGGNPNAQMRVKSMNAANMIARWAAGEGIDDVCDFIDRNITQEA